jgi:spore coat polysaccharide biosynthesis protein SpsF (cytidylyltransferase family)
MSHTTAIIQARMGSTRLPGKVLAPVGDRPLLAFVVAAVQAMAGVNAIVVATTTAPADRAVMALAERLGVRGFAGDEEDVLDRYYQAARALGAEAVVRVTADCPLLDPTISSAVVARFHRGDVDYASNCSPRTYPDGLDTEVIAFDALEQAWREAELPSEREHVTPFIWKRLERFRIAAVTGATDLSGLRWTVDEPEDLEFVRAVCERLAPARPPYRMEQILAVLDRAPELGRINTGFRSNEGYARSLERDPR